MLFFFCEIKFNKREEIDMLQPVPAISWNVR